MIVSLGLAIGSPIALAIFTFIYGKGYSYLSDDPRACINCHAMKEQFQSWSRSSHHGVAVCNSCHVPRSWIGKYTTKAVHGYRHSAAFTLQNYDEPIRMRDSSRNIVEVSCKNCHRPLFESTGSHHQMLSRDTSCIRCHSNVGHAQ